jgi:hypothetical protein
MGSPGGEVPHMSHTGVATRAEMSEAIEKTLVVHDDTDQEG